MKTVHFIFLIVFLLSGAPGVFAHTAAADLRPTQAGAAGPQGKVSFEETSGGLKVTAHVENAGPGLHGFHIHENGSCEDSGKAAGGHFNPLKVKHGFLPQDGLKEAHTGDFGNIDIGQDGRGNLELILPGLTLTEGEYDVAGRAIVMHAKPDDFGQPTGNAGDRVACGIITAEEQKSPA